MLPLKIYLNDNIRANLRNIRQDNPINGNILTAEQLSLAINKNRAWVSQIESGRLKAIRREDIISIYKFLYNIDDDAAEKKIEEYLNKDSYNSTYEYTSNKVSWDDDWDNIDTELLSDESFNLLIDSLEQYLSKIYSGLSVEEKRVMCNSLLTLIENLKANASITNRIIGLPFHTILTHSDDEIATSFLNDLANVLIKHIANTIGSTLNVKLSKDK